VGEVAWSAATAYVVGDEVVLTSTHRVYECIINNTNFTPQNNEAKWLDVGYTNKFRAMSRESGTGSIMDSAEPLILSFYSPTDSIQAIGLTELLGYNVKVVSTNLNDSSQNIVKDTTRIYTTSVYDWLTYYNSQDTPPNTDFLYATNSYSANTNSIISVELTSNSQPGSKIGHAVFGVPVSMGSLIEQGAGSTVLNFSSITRDTFGKATIVQRANKYKTNCTFTLPVSYLDQVYKIRESLNTIPTAWFGMDTATSLTSSYSKTFAIFGFYRTFSINAASNVHMRVSLEVEEL
jgi:hypothetical protein